MGTYRKTKFSLIKLEAQGWVTNWKINILDKKDL